MDTVLPALYTTHSTRVAQWLLPNTATTRSAAITALQHMWHTVHHVGTLDKLVLCTCTLPSRLRSRPTGCNRLSQAGVLPAPTTFKHVANASRTPHNTQDNTHCCTATLIFTISHSEPWVPGWVHPAECLWACCCFSQLQCLLVDGHSRQLILRGHKRRKVLQPLKHLDTTGQNSTSSERNLCCDERNCISVPIGQLQGSLAGRKQSALPRSTLLTYTPHHQPAACSFRPVP